MRGQRPPRLHCCAIFDKIVALRFNRLEGRMAEGVTLSYTRLLSYEEASYSWRTTLDELLSVFAENGFTDDDVRGFCDEAIERAFEEPGDDA